MQQREWQNSLNLYKKLTINPLSVYLVTEGFAVHLVYFLREHSLCNDSVPAFYVIFILFLFFANKLNLTG